MKQKHGYTLIEISIASAILTIVSLLSFIVIRSSAEASQVTSAKDDVQSNLRNVMGTLTAEIRQAYTTRILDGSPPPGVVPIAVSNGGRQLTFMVPVPSDSSPLPNASAPITIRHENEDTGDPPNGLLDGGEDTNGDGALTRRVVRIQNGQTAVLGASNDISDITFQLRQNPSDNIAALTELRIWIESTKRYGPGGGKRVRGELESIIPLQN